MTVAIETRTTPETGLQGARTCHNCGQPLGETAIECPGCGAINLDKGRRRKEENRPERQMLREVTSQNHNGSYQIYRNSDGSLSCTCLQFLFQKGARNGTGFSTCKHIRAYLEENPETPKEGAEPPSDWQAAALKRLGVEASEHLTNDQAYFIFRDLLIKQGVEYREYEKLLRTHGTVNILPIYSFGVEFEGGVGSEHGIVGLARKLSESGIPCNSEVYNHETRSYFKIVSDGSLSMRDCAPLELVTPKLFGTGGFELIRKVLKIWNDLGGTVNRTCGTHVHIDAWNWDVPHMLELARIWAKIEARVLWYLISPSRRGNSFCKRVDRNYLIALLSNPLGDTDRYYSLNLNAFVRYRTIEFRIHNGTTEAKKIIPWIIFLLKLTDAVKRGLKYQEVEPTFEGVMDAVGMDNSATSVIRDARNYLYGRYMHWKEDAEANPSHMPQVAEVDLDGIDEEAARRGREARQSSMRYRYHNRYQGMTTRNNELPATSVNNLAALGPSAVIEGAVLAKRHNNGVWEVPSRQGETTYRVTLNEGDDTLSCVCRSFRANQRCYHSINVARYLVLQRELQGV